MVVLREQPNELCLCSMGEHPAANRSATDSLRILKLVLHRTHLDGNVESVQFLEENL